METKDTETPPHRHLYRVKTMRTGRALQCEGCPHRIIIPVCLASRMVRHRRSVGGQPRVPFVPHSPHAMSVTAGHDYALDSLLCAYCHFQFRFRTGEEALCMLKARIMRSDCLMVAEPLEVQRARSRAAYATKVARKAAARARHAAKARAPPPSPPAPVEDASPQ